MNLHRIGRPILAGFSAAAVALAAQGAASSVLATDAPGNDGTVKIHEGASEQEPLVRNEPQVCTFHLHFFLGDDVQGGDWWIEAWAPGDDKGEVVLNGDYDATNGEDREPELTDAPNMFTLPDGHYKLYWEGAANPGGQLNIKHKVFWVDCAPGQPTPTPTPAESEAAATPTPTPTPSQSEAATPTPSPSESDSGSTASPTPTPTPSESEAVATQTPSQSDAAQGTPREDTLGGNPTPGVGVLPNTATDAPTTQVPATLLALMALSSLSVLMYVRLAGAPARR